MPRLPPDLRSRGPRTRNSRRRGRVALGARPQRAQCASAPDWNAFVFFILRFTSLGGRPLSGLLPLSPGRGELRPESDRWLGSSSPVQRGRDRASPSSPSSPLHEDVDSLPGRQGPGSLACRCEHRACECPAQRRGGDFNAVGQALVPQYSHELTERNGPLFFGFRQSGAGVFEVQAVHFLLGQALQKAEIVDGNDSGQVFPTAGDDGPLLPMGGAVYDFGKLFLRLRDIEACHLYDSTTSIEQERACCKRSGLHRIRDAGERELLHHNRRRDHALPFPAAHAQRRAHRYGVLQHLHRTLVEAEVHHRRRDLALFDHGRRRRASVRSSEWSADCYQQPAIHRSNQIGQALTAAFQHQAIGEWCRLLAGVGGPIANFVIARKSTSYSHICFSVIMHLWNKPIFWLPKQRQAIWKFFPAMQITNGTKPSPNTLATASFSAAQPVKRRKPLLAPLPIKRSQP